MNKKQFCKYLGPMYAVRGYIWVHLREILEQILGHCVDVQGEAVPDREGLKHVCIYINFRSKAP